MTPVKPWARGPLEVLQHAEEHRLGTRDFDRRVALIGFDNAIESSVITYLSLNPVQRGGRNFPKADVDRWLTNFHSKIEFLEHFAISKQQVMPIGRPEIIYYHSLRNDLYHNGNGVVPAAEHIDGARRAALWTFATLFDCDAEALLVRDGSRDAHAAVERPLQLSASTAFLESFIQTKNELSQLLAAMNKVVGGTVGLDRLLRLLQDDFEVPTSVVNATVQAEKTKELVVQGDEERIDEAALRSLTSELGTVAEYLRQRLRSYQLEIVDTAVSSTLASARSDGRAGIVHQVTGSGLSMTLLAYLVRCRETRELAGLPRIILVDRVESGTGLIERMRDFPSASELRTAVMPSTALELEGALEALNSRLIVTTWQMLRKLSRDRKFSYSCIVVCFSFVHVGIPDFDLKSLFPRGNFILFSPRPVRQGDRRFEIFGELIRTYDFRAAVADGYMLPVRIEQYSLAPSHNEPELSSEIRGRRPHGLPAESVRAIASALLDDIRGKLRFGIHHSVLITKSRASVTAFTQELTRLAAEHAGRIGTEKLVVVQLGGSPASHHLHNERESLVVWISTIELLAGVDFGPSVACYVACKVSQDAQYRLVAMVARPRGDAREAFIVDYADNVWDSPRLFTSDNEARSKS